MLSMFHPWEQLSLGGSIALRFIGDDHARHVGQPLEQLAKELLRHLLIAATLYQDIKAIPVLIDRPPEIMSLALDGEKDLIEMPLVTRPRPSTPELSGILLTKLTTPLANGFIGHNDAAFKEQFFNIAEAQAEP